MAASPSSFTSLSFSISLPSEGSGSYANAIWSRFLVSCRHPPLLTTLDLAWPGLAWQTRTRSGSFACWPDQQLASAAEKRLVTSSTAEDPPADLADSHHYPRRATSLVPPSAHLGDHFIWNRQASRNTGPAHGRNLVAQIGLCRAIPAPPELYAVVITLCG